VEFKNEKLEKLQHGYLSTNLAICTALWTGDSLAAGFIDDAMTSVGSGCLQFKVNYLCYLSDNCGKS